MVKNLCEKKKEVVKVEITENHRAWRRGARGKVRESGTAKE